MSKSIEQTEEIIHNKKKILQIIIKDLTYE